MDYKSNYYDYINYVKSLDRKLDYSEIHHIVPRCLGGTDDENNLVILTAREHFLAHYLLTKIYSDNMKIIDAFRMMGVVNTTEQERYINSRLYESKKKLFSEARSKKVLCIETGEIFPSATYVEKNITTGVRDVIYGRQFTAGGYHWKYLDEDLKIIKKPYERKKVVCVETEQIFDSVDEVAKLIGVNSSLIKSLCNGNKKGKAKGYHWKYI